MPKALTDPDQIAATQRQLEDAFKRGARPFLGRQVGYQGGSVAADVYWQDKFGYWGSLNRRPLADDEAAYTRFWNAFGFQDPGNTKASLSIACEANPAHQSVDLRCAGLFARDENGASLLLHTGRLNGVTLVAFWREYQGDRVSVQGGRYGDYAIVAMVGAPQMVEQIGHFVSEARRIKKLVRGR